MGIKESTADPRIAPHPVSFSRGIGEMPQDLNSRVHPLVCAKTGVIMRRSASGLRTYQMTAAVSVKLVYPLLCSRPVCQALPETLALDLLLSALHVPSINQCHLQPSVCHSVIHLEMRKSRPRKVAGRAQGHQPGRPQSQACDPGLSTFQAHISPTVPGCPSFTIFTCFLIKQ